MLETLAFWLDLAPQLFGAQARNTGPPHPRRDKQAYRDGLTSLPTEIDASEAGWLPKLHSAMAQTGEPAVIRGLLYDEHFGNLTELTVDRLRAEYGDTEVGVFTHMTKDKSVIDMPFSEFADKMGDASELLYARAMPDTLNLWTKRLDLKWITDELVGKPAAAMFTHLTTVGSSMNGKLPLAFVGSNQVWTQCHCDLGTSVFMAVQGRKRWVLYPPSQSQYLYPYGQYRNVAYNAGLDVFDPNMTHTPEFAKARGYEVTLNTGDVLIFPSFWWHGVQNLDEHTVGIDIPILDPVGSWSRNAPLLLHTLLNPLTIRDILTGLRHGGSLRGIFFAGYRTTGQKEGE